MRQQIKSKKILKVEATCTHLEIFCTSKVRKWMAWCAVANCASFIYIQLTLLRIHKRQLLSCIFMTCIFISSNFIFCGAVWSVIFMSDIFSLLLFLVRQFQVLHFSVNPLRIAQWTSSSEGIQMCWKCRPIRLVPCTTYGSILYCIVLYCYKCFSVGQDIAVLSDVIVITY